MRLTRILQASLLPVIVIGCATTNPKATPHPVYFSQSEAAKLKYCLALSDTIRAMAEMKANGKSQSDVLSYYQKGGMNNELTGAFVKKVFSENSEQIWNYTIGSMGECANEVANVTAPAQVQAAKFCMQKQLIAQISKRDSEDGKSISDVHGRFNDFADPMTKIDIEDAVRVGYSWRGSRTGLFERVGEQCIDRYASK